MAWMATGAEVSQEQVSPKKGPGFFEIHWTSDAPKSTVDLSNHLYGLCRTLLATHCL